MAAETQRARTKNKPQATILVKLRGAVPAPHRPDTQEMGNCNPCLAIPGSKASVAAQAGGSAQHTEPKQESLAACALLLLPPSTPAFSQLFLCLQWHRAKGTAAASTMKWAETQTRHKRCLPHGRKPQSGAELLPQRQSPARLCQQPLAARSQPELTAAMTPHVSPAIVCSLEKLPGRLSCVKAQISAFYRAPDAFCTLVTEG